jgi:hypothetical protein
MPTAARNHFAQKPSPDAGSYECSSYNPGLKVHRQTPGEPPLVRSCWQSFPPVF